MSKYLDSRELIERREELESERDNYQHETGGSVLKAWEEANPEEYEELSALIELCEECEGYGDWDYGTTLIPEHDWVNYVREMLEDCGYLPKNIPDFIVIDWEATADNIAQDYTTVDYLGDAYYIRAC